MDCPACFKDNGDGFAFSYLCYVHSLRFVNLDTHFQFVNRYNKLVREKQIIQLSRNTINNVYMISLQEDKFWDLNSYVDERIIIGTDENSKKYLIFNDDSLDKSYTGITNIHKLTDCYIINSDRIYVVPLSIKTTQIG